MLMHRIVGTNLIIPHIVGNAGVLRNFSAYLSQLLDVDSKTDLQVHLPNGLDLDFLAFGLSLGLTLLLILGTHETSLFNLGEAPFPAQICSHTLNNVHPGHRYNITWRSHSEQG